jgi:hypothetical protein
VTLAFAARATLGRFVRLLASDRDGEVVAAARALGRALKAHGADFHALAAFIEAPSPAPAPASSGGGFRDPFDDDDPDWETMVAACVRNLGRFTAKEREFLASMEHWRGDPTPKQFDWLVALFKRARRAA